MRKLLLLLCLGLVIIYSFPSLLTAKSEDDMTIANQFVNQSIISLREGNLETARQQYKSFYQKWISIEDGVKKRSKEAYKSIEGAMGDVSFAFAQEPADSDKILSSLDQLQHLNLEFIQGNLSAFKKESSSAKERYTVITLLNLLDGALDKLKEQDIAAAKINMENFKKSWLEVEGIVLTQSASVYGATERDMVNAYALLSSNPPNLEGAAATIASMRKYLTPLAGKTKYSMFDATTILLREGLEALLVIVALLGFLKKSGHDSKRKWIWYGVGSGILVSIILGIIVQLLFSSGAFGNNNFLITGYTGVFAAVMLLYMSYWLHSKSSMSQWQQYIRNQSTKALATGSLVSIAVLSFLAVFREGTETVLFFIGMASSIELSQLLLGILFGVLSMLILAFLILKVGLKIPMRPFFLFSSVLVFYLCFKFTGMGIHGLQLAGILKATTIQPFPTIDFLALYPTWENLVPQSALIVFAIAAVLLSKRKEILLQKENKLNQ